MSDSLRAEIERFDPSPTVERALTPPSSWYTSPEIYDLERRAVFRDSWQPVCRRDEVAEPGQFASGCGFGEPWVVLRDDEGTLRAFANACRHKGREVVTGSGRAASLVCGYHGWTYSLSGRLESAPRMAGVEGFDRKALSLPALSVCEWGPWVFVRAGADGASLRDEVPELSAALEATGFDALELRGRRTWDLACNWKVYVDNYLDGGYHIAHMHPSLAEQLDLKSYRTDVFARGSLQSSLPGAGLDGDEDNRRIGGRALYAWLYPAFMVNRYGPCLDSNYVLPLAADRCRVVYELWFEPGVSDAFVESSMAQTDVTQREDIEICESVQRGLASSSYDRGRYAPRLEHGDHAFHTLLAKDLLRALPPRRG